VVRHAPVVTSHHFHNRDLDVNTVRADRPGHSVLSVRKVVLTLTSKSVEIYLLMAGAKQLGDTGFILVPAGAVRPAAVCSRHCNASHRGACRGGLQARRERRPGL
jgi:hypothetical protein